MNLKNQNPKKIVILLFSFIFLFQLIIPSTQALANNDLLTLFGKESYTTYHTIDEVMNRTLNVSNKHQLKYFSILAKWKTYSVNDQERVQDVQGYVDMVIEDLQFVLNYTDTEIGKKFKERFLHYQSDMKKVVKDTNLFYDNSVIFFNYIMDSPELEMWYSYYSQFKNNILVPFSNQYIYNNDVRINIKKIREGNDTERKEGISELKKVIANLKSYQNSKDTPNIMKGYCKEAIKHFNNVIDGKKSDLSKLIRADRYWVEGLIQVGQEFDKIQEYNFYVMKFNQFSDFPTIELSKKLKSKELNQFVTMLQSVPAHSKEVIELKKKHYDLIYAISNYKNKNELPIKIEQAYPDFFKYYHYLDTYFLMVQEQYGINFNSDNVKKEIEAYKTKLSCLDTKFDDFYTNVNYAPVQIEDTTEYRNLAIKDAVNWGKMIPYALIGVFVVVVGVILYKVIASKRQNHRHDDYYDDYYDNYY